MPEIDWTKPIQTRDGRKARVLATDLRGRRNKPIAVVVTTDGEDQICQFFRNGRYSCGEMWDLDIINAPTKRKAWVNIFRNNDDDEDHLFDLHTDEDAANSDWTRHLGYRFIATVPIEWE